MIKKLIMVMVLLVLLAGYVYAGQTEVVMINDETLTGVADRTEADRYIGDAERVTFFVTYDQDGTTVGVTSTVTVAVSVDGTNWQDI